MPYDTNYGKPDRFRAPPPPISKKQPDPDPTFMPLPDPVPWVVIPPGGGGGALYGQVTDGSGTTYTVQTFSAGPGGPPDDPAIQVTVLGIDDTETIPAGTWIGSIATSTDSQGNTIGWCTVPIWMDSSSGGGG